MTPMSGKSSDISRKRVYICHTFYHAYIAAVKELISSHSDSCRPADLILSTMSNDFGGFPERVDRSRIFGRVYMFDEQLPSASEEVMACHRDRGNIVLNLLQRIRYTKLLGRLQETYVPTDLSRYDDIYVFCDSDPIGYYLNYKKLHYHALEDGLNSGLLDNQARLSNKGAFTIKRIMAALGLIFMECGYSRYCIDYEVNDLSANYKPPKNMIENPCDAMYDRLTDKDHRLLTEIFLENAAELTDMLAALPADRPVVMILTEPLCELPVRKRLFGDVISMYDSESSVIIKPHPRDELDYEKEFPDTIVIRGRFPMEVMNDIPGLQVDKLVSVITQIDNIRFAKDIVYLGLDFLDKYEDPAIHRKMELLKKEEEKNSRS